MISIRENADLRKMTTFGLPARCGRLIEFSDPEKDLPELDRQVCLDDAVVLGGGSNVLFTSPGSNLTVIHPVEDTISISEEPDGIVTVTVGAGVTLDALCRLTTARRLWGLENLAGIPGHAGGAAVQNVGAYGTELSDVVDTVSCYSCRDRRFINLRADECGYGYRDSIFKHPASGGRLIVCRVSLRLSKSPTPRLGYQGLYQSLCDRFNLSHTAPKEGNISRMIELGMTPATVSGAVMSLRDSKLPDPAKTGSAGSFFKNPVVSPDQMRLIGLRWGSKDKSASRIPGHTLPDGNIKLSAAWLIDKAGCKPLTRGGAALWQSQPLVIVNQTGQAQAEDVIRLEQAVIARVEAAFGVTLVPEVIHI